MLLFVNGLVMLWYTFSTQGEQCFVDQRNTKGLKTEKNVKVNNCLYVEDSVNVTGCKVSRQDPFP